MANNVTILRQDAARLPARLQTSLADAKQALQPADPRHLALMLDETMQLWKLPENWETTAKFYLEALADLPADLAELALKRTRLNSTFTPKPAEIRQHVTEELRARRTNLRLAERAVRDYEPPTPPTTPEMRREMQQLLANLSKQLRTADAGKTEEELDRIST